MSAARATLLVRTNTARLGEQMPEAGSTAGSRILAFTTGPEDWRRLLADPEKHWRTGYSARTMACCWEATDGFPPEVAEALASEDPLLENLTPLLGIPEFKVPLPGGVRCSQNDLFVLGRCSAGAVPIMVEGKVNESFGPLLGDWLREASPGKRKRLAFLQEKLGLAGAVPESIRYQLLHRTASAVITGEQYRAAAAVMLVHSFSQERTGWADYRAFLELFGVDAEEGCVQRLPGASPIPLFAAWAVGDPRFLEA